MKAQTLFYKMVFLVLFTFLLPFAGWSQWEPDFQLTTTPGSYTSDNNAWCIAARDNQIHVVWAGSLTLTDAILYKNSPDGGVTWNEQVLLSAMYTYSSSPAVAVSGDHVHVVWSQTVAGNNSEIYYNHSTDGGATWIGAVRLTNSLLDSQHPVIAAVGQHVYVIWEDRRNYPPNGNYTELYFKKSSDGGVNWSEDAKLTTPVEENPGFPSIATNNGTLHLAYSKTPFSIGQEIFYCRFSEQAGTWSEPVRLSFNNQAGVGRYPTIGATGNNVYVFWSDSRDEVDYYELYFARSQDAGETWGSESRLTFAGDDSYGPNVAVSGDALHLIWNEHRDGNWEIYYKNSTDAGLSWSTDTRLTNDASDSWYPSVALNGQSVNVVWCDNRTGEWNVFYKRNPNGNPLGLELYDQPDLRTQEMIVVAPSPAEGLFSVQIRKDDSENNFDIQSLELANLYGEILEIQHPTPGTRNNELNITHLPAGTYFIRINFENQTIVKKLVKI